MYWKAREFSDALFFFQGTEWGWKVFNEAGSRCCNIVKILVIYIFFSIGSGACNPQVEQYILGPYNINSINLLWSEHLANNIHTLGG